MRRTAHERVRRADFDYGNTRLRARRGAFLSGAAYERLLGEDIDGVLRALQDTRYAPRAEAVRRLGGLHALHLTVRSELAGSLEQMRSFYSGRAGLLVDALLSRFDVQNVISRAARAVTPGHLGRGRAGRAHTGGLASRTARPRDPASA